MCRDLFAIFVCPLVELLLLHAVMMRYIVLCYKQYFICCSSPSQTISKSCVYAWVCSFWYYYYCTCSLEFYYCNVSSRVTSEYQIPKAFISWYTSTISIALIPKNEETENWKALTKYYFCHMFVAMFWCAAPLFASCSHKESTHMARSYYNNTLCRRLTVATRVLYDVK